MYKQYKLSNGLTVVIAPLAQTETVTCLLLVKAGSRYESEKIAGISHFLEHLMFKGTTKRPSTLAISKELDSIGAEYNAFTGKDHTGYYIKSAARSLKLSLDMLSDMIFNSLFLPTEIGREKGVIIEEMNMYKDNPIMYVEDMVEELVFSGNTLGRLIIGQKNTVRAVDQEKILAYHQQYYQPDNMVLVLSGKVGAKDLDLVKKYFAAVKEGKSVNRFSVFHKRQKKVKIKTTYKKTDQMQVALSWPSLGYQDKAAYATAMLSIILGGNMSSRLFIEIRERRGLAYYVRAANNPYQDTGCFVIQAGLDKKRWLPAVKIILAEVEKIKKSGVSAEELSRAKEFLSGKMAIDLEDSSHLAEWYGRQKLLTGKMLTPASRLDLVKKVSASDVMAVARQIFVENKLNLAVIGPVKKVKSSDL